MTEDIQVGKSRRGCWLYLLGIVFGLPILLIGLVLLIFGWRDASAGRRLQQRLDAISSEGLPVDNATMEAYYNSLTTTEQTDDWLAVLEEMQSQEFRDSIEGVPIFDGKVDVETQFVPAGEPWVHEAATRRFLDRWSSVYRKALQLSIDAEPTRWPMEFDSFNTNLQNTQEMRSVARLISLDGNLALYDQDSGGVRRNVLALARLPRVLEGEPLFVSQLVAAAISSMGVDLFREGVQQGVLDSNDIDRLLREYRNKTNVGQAWRRSIVGERGFAMPVFRDPGVLGDGRALAWFRNNDANTALDIYEKAIEASTEDPAELLKNTQELEAWMQERFGSMNLLQQFDSILSGMLTPAMAAGGRAFSRIAIQHRIAILAGGVRMFEQETGSFPEDLSELSKYGIDVSQLQPPGGKPFGYRVEDGEAVLWGFPISVGDVSSTPEQPPSLALGEPNRGYNELWVWRLKPSAPEDE
ncbi:MAG TPA: hypothetical protein DDW52_01870 [Planctomycetaceae bacterium]|nr:hypothetical protein [Planctomycetaceae bacterium]